MSRRLGIALVLIFVCVAWWMFRSGGAPAPPEETVTRPKPRVTAASMQGRSENRNPGDAAPLPADEAMRAERRRANRLAASKLAGQPVPMAPPRTMIPLPSREEELSDMIKTALDDPDPTARASAISDLSLHNDVDLVVPVIRQAASDRDPDVKLAVVEALGQLGEAVPLDVLAEYVNDSDPEIRLEALGAVETLMDEEKLVPSLKPILDNASRDPNEEVRERAQDIIETNSEE